MTERKFKYEWRRTRPDISHDFACFADGHCIGRIYLHTTGGDIVWVRQPRLGEPTARTLAA